MLYCNKFEYCANLYSVLDSLIINGNRVDIQIKLKRDACAVKEFKQCRKNDKIPVA